MCRFLLIQRWQSGPRIASVYASISEKSELSISSARDVAPVGVFEEFSNEFRNVGPLSLFVLLGQ